MSRDGYEFLPEELYDYPEFDPYIDAIEFLDYVIETILVDQRKYDKKYMINQLKSLLGDEPQRNREYCTNISALITNIEKGRMIPESDKSDQPKIKRAEVFELLDSLKKSGNEPTETEQAQLRARKVYVSQWLKQWLKKNGLDDCLDDIFERHLEKRNLGDDEILELIKINIPSQYFRQKLLWMYENGLWQGKYHSRLEQNHLKLIVKPGRGDHKRYILDTK